MSLLLRRHFLSAAQHSTRTRHLSAMNCSFLVLVDDHTDAGALARRQETRAAHLAGAASLKAQGTLVSAGALLDSHESGGRMVGSTLVINAASPDDVMALLRNDPYVAARVWNLDSARILPFRPASF
ncbi:hypothetical protein H4R18_001437 [Coemansia javaensis]|uniref:YCII-related domain-containing protein n=1 Tax=Coemansia javaensis TaxID=2761396 RepID=A0A9W8HLG9_9FUNG|nr:hypothetical protein H4R18_001437 [Coemansia javaensis]